MAGGDHHFVPDSCAGTHAPQRFGGGGEAEWPQAISAHSPAQGHSFEAAVTVLGLAAKLNSSDHCGFRLELEAPER